uniref:Uncharacterized protein n=1 Tax=Lepeophtheirus salmonis TaxID=72036 RepID=A0A0K2UMU7_LEPSM
MVKIQIEKHN